MSLALCQPLASVSISTLGEILALRQVGMGMGMMPQGQQQATWCWFVSGVNLVRSLHWDRVHLASLPASAKALLSSCCSEFGIPYPTVPDPLDRLSAGWLLAVPSIRINSLGSEGWEGKGAWDQRLYA